MDPIKTVTRYPNWLDLAEVWLRANVNDPVLVVYTRDPISLRRRLVAWGVDPDDTVGSEFLVVPMESTVAARGALRDLNADEAFGLVWDGRRIVDEGP